MPIFMIKAQNVKSAEKTGKLSEIGMAERKQAIWRPRERRALPSKQ